MQAKSQAVHSNQPFVHPRLGDIVRRHLQKPSRKPVADYNRRAFEALQSRMAEAPAPLILDSFCGTGQSTAMLAENYPEHLVVGIDKSAHRLNKHQRAARGNYLLLRAECEDIWTLILEQGWALSRHYLLYPNPWPKASQIQRRIHGHPALAQLLTLGGEVELRSNWQTYVEEFGLALHLAGHRGIIDRVPATSPAMTLFESKYRLSAHPLWRYRGRLGPAP